MLIKTKRYYNKKFKLQSIAMAEERENVAQAARELDIRSDMLKRWIREYNKKKVDSFKGTGNLPKPQDRKLSKKQRLKKAVHIFSKNDRIDTDSL